MTPLNLEIESFRYPNVRSLIVASYSRGLAASSALAASSSAAMSGRAPSRHPAVPGTGTSSAWHQGWEAPVGGLDFTEAQLHSLVQSIDTDGDGRLSFPEFEGYVAYKSAKVQVAEMKKIVLEALDHGACGFATSTLEQHNGHAGIPMPSRLADEHEMMELTGALGEAGKGAFMLTKGMKTTVPWLENISEKNEFSVRLERLKQHARGGESCGPRSAASHLVWNSP